MTAKEYCTKFKWLKTPLTDAEYLELARLELFGRDAEMDYASATVKRDADLIGLKIDWR